MKKKILFLFALISIVCVFAIAVSAAPQSYASFEAIYNDGTRVTVYTVGIDDVGNGRICLRETMYTEAPLDSEGTYATLDWSKVEELDFTNTMTCEYVSSNGAYVERTGGSNGSAKGRICIKKSWSDASVFNSVKKVNTGNTWSFSGAVFSGWKGLETVIISNKVETLTDDLFKDSSVANVIFEEGAQVYRCNNNLFWNCDNLVRVEFPDSFTYLGNSNLFYDCDNLESVRWPSNCPEIPSGAFAYCEKFKFEIPSYITNIKSSAFRNCKAITSLVIPASVSQIGSDCFRECTNLTSIVFEEGCSVQNIYAHTFDSCNLTEIYLPNTVKQIKQSAFSSNKNLKVISLGASFIDFNLEGNASASLGTGSNLEKMYLPKTFTVDSVRSDMFGDDNNPNEWVKIFPSVVIYYEGDAEMAQAIITKAQGDGTVINGVLANVTLVSLEEYEALKEAGALTGRYLIHSYNKCDAFYGGVHAEGQVLNSCQFGCGRSCGQVELLENPQHSLAMVETKGENGYFGNICFVESCSVCKTKTIDETISPIFEWKGYSVSTFGDKLSVTQGYKIDKNAIADYRKYVPDFNFGIMATVNTEKVEIAPSLDEVYVSKFDNDANDYIDIQLSGITEETRDVLVVFCIYATDGEALSYLDNGVQASTVMGISYNQALALDKETK